MKAKTTILLAGCLVTASPAVAGQYVFTDVSDPGCCISDVIGLNDHGKVLGFYDSLETVQESFTVRGNTVKVIGASVGLVVSGNLTNRGLAVGSAGGIGTGYIVNVNTDKLTPLPTVGSYLTAPASINLKGDVVGVAIDSTGSISHGYLYSGGKASLFDPPGSTSTNASVINNGGEVAGSYQATKRLQKLFTYLNGKFTTYAVPDAVQLLTVYAIDETGNLGGEFTDSSGMKNGFVVMNGKVSVVNYPDAKETSFNAFGPGGELVGYSVDNNNFSTSHGFIYLNGTFTRVDDPKQSMFGSSLSAVNASGVLAGDYFDGNGYGHPFTAVCPSAQAPCTK